MAEEGGGKLKVLVIGGTGYIGKFIVGASIQLGHPTSALVRRADTPSDPAKARLLQDFVNSGVTLVQGNLLDHESLVRAVKGVDVVISAVGYLQISDQIKILHAIKEVGNVKRFVPSEFGNDVDRAHIEEPAKSAIFDVQAQFRRAVEASGVPYTIISCNFFASYYLPTLLPLHPTPQPTATDGNANVATILGDGNVQVIYVDEEDVGTYTMKAANDPKMVNKILFVRPPANTLTHNQLVTLWENKSGSALQRIYIAEEDLLKQMHEAASPLDLDLAICHSVFVKGDHTNFEIDPSFGAEATELYPDVKYITVDEILDRFI